jgi:hypothetical protein
MDLCAELTLQIAHLVHEQGNPPRSPACWQLLPHGGRASWTEAREILSRAPKPLMVAPLAEPGCLGLWSLGNLDEKGREILQHETDFLADYYSDRLEGYDTVVFTPSTSELRWSADELHRWSREYSMAAVDVWVVKDSRPGVARLTVRPAGGTAPPLGMETHPVAPH